MCGVTARLGVWQLDRAAQKETYSQARAHAQPSQLTGQWDRMHTVYVDNRQMTIGGHTRQGFFVVTPLFISDQDYVLVERGWMARDFMDRKHLQAVQTPAGDVVIAARRVADPAPPAVFATEANAEYPIVQFVDVSAFAKALPDKAYKGMVQQIGEPSEGLQRNWYEPASGAEKNYGYAFQWFALCALVLVLYVWFQWIKKHE